MSLRNIFFLLVVLLLASCEKIELDSEFTGTPVFSMDLDIDGVVKTLTAGNENYYQFTGKNIEQGAFEFYGDLRQENCIDICGESLKITFRSDRIAPTVIPAGASLKYKESNPAVTPKARIQLEAVPFGEPPFSHVWEFEDPSIDDLTGDRVVIEFDDFASQRIKLTTTDNDGCENISERNIDLSDLNPFSNGCNDYILFIEPVVDSSGFGDPNFFVFLFNNFGAPDSAVWDDGTIGFVNNFNVDSIQGDICVTVYDQGCEADYCLSMTVPTDNSPSNFPKICATQFTTQKEVVFEQGDTTQLNTVLVEYTDETGKVFSSEISPQSVDSYFNVTDSQPFEVNEKGEPTRILDVKFSCKIASPDGETMTINLGQGTFGVGE